MRLLMHPKQQQAWQVTAKLTHTATYDAGKLTKEGWEDHTQHRRRWQQRAAAAAAAAPRACGISAPALSTSADYRADAMLQQRLPPTPGGAQASCKVELRGFQGAINGTNRLKNVVIHELEGGAGPRLPAAAPPTALSRGGAS